MGKKYKTCYACGRKPKAYQDDGQWFIDHMCVVQTGAQYLGADTLAELQDFWNERQQSPAPQAGREG
jgi:hypothetical protein